jgi:hypothetical protein
MNFFKTEKFWNLLFTFSFLAVIILLGNYLYDNHYDIGMFKLQDFIIVTLAAYRMTRLLVYDKVLDFIRDVIIKNKSESGFFQSTRYFLTCPWCAGLWMTFFVIVLYLFIPFGKLFVYILAIAGVASFLHVVITLLGWVSEERKFYIKTLKKQQKGKSNC